jgi:tetratricopeptide (TPR) repeat protein
MRRLALPWSAACLSLVLAAASASAAPQPAVESAPAAQRSAAREQDLAQAVAEGRAALAAGRLAEARTAFERAAELDRGGIESRFWLSRLEIAEGEHEALLSKLSRLRREGKAGPDEAYLQALALEALASEALARGASGVGLMLEDAFNALEPVSKADNPRYRDAHLPLARVARQLGRHPAGEAAARRALALEPNSIEAAGLLGRALLGQVAALGNSEADAARRAPLCAEAVSAFESALALLGADPSEPSQRQIAADLCYQLGNAHAFAQDQGRAEGAYARAIGLDPSLVDFAALRGTLGDERFVAACRDGSAQFVARYGEQDPRDATTQWWLGFALWGQGQPDQRASATAAFESALAKYPAYLNSLYYLTQLAYDEQQYERASEHLLDYFQRSPEGLAQMLGDDRDLLRVEFLVGAAVNAGRLDRAAALTRVLCAARPETSRFWNNLGLFQRDEGDQRMAKLKAEDPAEQERAEIQALWEASLEAYERALALEPKNPAYLNDTAVILHYNLRRDFERALALYAEATVEANRLLEAGGLDPETKDVVQIALRDSKNNRRTLERQLEKAKQDKQAPAPAGS